jgi:hypothetical protein
MTSLDSHTIVPTATVFGRLITGAPVGLEREVLVTVPIMADSVRRLN